VRQSRRLRFPDAFTLLPCWLILRVYLPAPFYQSAISDHQAPAWSCLAEPSLWPDTKRERVSFCCRVLPCDGVSVRVSAHFQKHFIRIGDGQSLFNQAMLNQNAMIRRYCQSRWMGLRSALVLFGVFHCTMLTRFLIAFIFFWRSCGDRCGSWFRADG
jgi:hypothetical protein